MKKVFALFIAALFMASINAEGINLKAKKSKNTKVEPVCIQTVNVKHEIYQDLEGILFLFEITKLKNNDKVLCFQELRDFNIDGVSYAQITKEKLGISIEPHTEILESSKFIKENPGAKKIVKNEKNGILMQTVIYGTKLPESGKITVTAQIGWGDVNEEKTESLNSETEDFVFEFELSSLIDKNTQITKKQKQELLKLINDFKKDKNFSKEHLRTYSPIIEFASENKTVKIEINPNNFSGLISSPEYAPLFLLAFISGNLEKQLVSGNYTNAEKEGKEFQLLKYKQLKEIDKNINIEFFEEMMKE